jgi:hypothetical protein
MNSRIGLDKRAVFPRKRFSRCHGVNGFSIRSLCRVEGRWSRSATQPAPTVSEHAHVVSNETAEQPRLEPMKWDGSEREEIRQRIANFKAHQQRFTREREDYALSTLMRVQGGVTAPHPDAPKRKV